MYSNVVIILKIEPGIYLPCVALFTNRESLESDVILSHISSILSGS